MNAPTPSPFRGTKRAATEVINRDCTNAACIVRSTPASPHKRKPWAEAVRQARRHSSSSQSQLPTMDPFVESSSLTVFQVHWTPPPSPSQTSVDSIDSCQDSAFTYRSSLGLNLASRSITKLRTKIRKATPVSRSPHLSSERESYSSADEQQPLQVPPTIAHLQAELAASREENHRLSSENADLHERLIAQDQDSIDTKNNLIAAKTQLGALKAVHRQQVQHAVKVTKKQARKTSQDRERYWMGRDTIRRRRHRVSKHQLRRARAELAETRDVLNTTQNIFSCAKKALHIRYLEVAELHRGKDEAQTALQLCNQRNLALETSVQTLKAELKDAGQQINATEDQIDGLGEQKRQLRLINSRMRTEKQKLNNQISTLTTSRQAWRQERQELETDLRQRSEQLSEVIEEHMKDRALREKADDDIVSLRQAFEGQKNALKECEAERDRIVALAREVGEAGLVWQEECKALRRAKNSARKSARDQDQRTTKSSHKKHTAAERMGLASFVGWLSGFSS